MRANTLKNRLFMAVLASTACSQAYAAEDDFSVYGFVNLGIYYKDQEYTTIESYQDGDTRYFDEDTMLGLQVSKPLSERTAATVQAVARADNDYAVETSLAFISHALNSDTDIRAGRLRIPFFYYSEFLDVGYAYNWVRPSSDVYSIPFKDYDGVDLTHRFSLLGTDAQVQVNSGRRHKEIDLFGDNYDSELNAIQGISLTMFSGDFSYRVGYQQTEMNLTLVSDPGTDQAAAVAAQTAAANALNAGASAEQAQLAAAGAALSTYESADGYRRVDVAQSMARFIGTNAGYSSSVIDDFDLEEKLARYFNVATTYDNGSFSAVLEATHLNYESGLLVDNFAWMASAAQRFGDVTLHATYSTSRDRIESGDAGKLQKTLMLQGEDDSVTVGVRYDLDAATALKFEMTHHDEETNQGQPGRSANLYRMALQLVF